jgi:anti-sigma factor RsiW
MGLNKIKSVFKKVTGCYNCRQTEQLLFDYIEGDLDPVRQRKLKQHLGDCRECLAFVETYRQAIASGQDQKMPSHVAMPPRLRAKLEEFIRNNPEFK